MKPFAFRLSNRYHLLAAGVYTVLGVVMTCEYPKVTPLWLTGLFVLASVMEFAEYFRGRRRR